MSVDLAAVRRIARLARIAVTDAEAPHLQNEINAILNFVEELGAVDVEGVERPAAEAGPQRTSLGGTEVAIPGVHGRGARTPVP